MDHSFIYSEVSLSDFQTHIRHLVEEVNDSNTFEIRIEDICAEFSLIRNTYKVKPTTLSLLIRTSDVGRDNIYGLHNLLILEPYTLKIRKSPKKKLINQIKIVWDTADSSYPLSVISGLKKVCSQLDASWPPDLSIGYYSLNSAHQDLPGKLTVNSLLWNTGHVIGKVIGQIAVKL